MKILRVAFTCTALPPRLCAFLVQLYPTGVWLPVLAGHSPTSALTEAAVLLAPSCRPQARRWLLASAFSSSPGAAPVCPLRRSRSAMLLPLQTLWASLSLNELPPGSPSGCAASTQVVVAAASVGTHAAVCHSASRPLVSGQALWLSPALSLELSCNRHGSACCGSSICIWSYPHPALL